MGLLGLLEEPADPVHVVAEDVDHEDAVSAEAQVVRALAAPWVST